MKFILTDIITVDREVEIVDTCPNSTCEADLTQPGAFVLWDYHDESMEAENTEWLGEKGIISGDYLDSGEDYLGGDRGGHELRCKACGSSIVMGESIKSRISDDNRETMIRKGIDLLKSRLAELSSRN